MEGCSPAAPTREPRPVIGPGELWKSRHPSDGSRSCTDTSRRHAACWAASTRRSRSGDNGRRALRRQRAADGRRNARRAGALSVTDHRPTPGSAHAASTIVFVALIILGLIGCFTGVTRYADEVGVGRARATITGIERLGDVILFSDRNLHIRGGGTRCVLLPGDEGALRYRYDGLTLCTHVNERLLLLPARYGRDVVAEILVPPINRRDADGHQSGGAPWRRAATRSAQLDDLRLTFSHVLC